MVLRMKEKIGDFRVYEDKEENGPVVLKFCGVQHPMKEEEVVPTIQKVLDRTIDKLTEKLESGLKMVDLDETIGFLQMIRDLTVPEVGYFYCPNPPNLETQPILTKYGQKLKEQENE